jgi:hypothetical protein
VVVGELLPDGVEVDLAFPVEQDLHHPPTEVAACFPQCHRGQPPAVEKFDERVLELLLAKRVIVDEDDKLEVLVAGAILFLR